jgi:hypothetical protein
MKMMQKKLVTPFKSSGYGPDKIKSKLVQSDARKYLIFVLKRIQTCCISKKISFVFSNIIPKYVLKYLFKVDTYYIKCLPKIHLSFQNILFLIN